MRDRAMSEHVRAVLEVTVFLAGLMTIAHPALPQRPRWLRHLSLTLPSTIPPWAYVVLNQGVVSANAALWRDNAYIWEPGSSGSPPSGPKYITQVAKSAVKASKRWAWPAATKRKSPGPTGRRSSPSKKMPLPRMTT